MTTFQEAARGGICMIDGGLAGTPSQFEREGRRRESAAIDTHILGLISPCPACADALPARCRLCGGTGRWGTGRCECHGRKACDSRTHGKLNRMDEVIDTVIDHPIHGRLYVADWGGNCYGSSFVTFDVGDLLGEAI